MEINRNKGFGFLLSIVSLFIVTSCATYNLTSQEMYGKYLQKDNKAIQLELKQGSFLLKDINKQEHLPPFKCCDTIAYGKWEIYKKSSIIEVSSSETLNNSYVYVNVIEEQEPSLDSIKFVINNPIEQHYKKFGEKYRELIYSIVLVTEDDYISKTSDSNPLLMKSVKGLKTVEITVYPKYDIPIREVSTREVYILPYEVQNSNTNVFKVDIPQLDYGYLSYRRLNKDYIKIINKNRLMWNGKEYFKK